MLLAALQQVEKYYGEQTVLDGVTLELHDASRTALVGRNGAGKSTILNLLAGRVEPDGGLVFLREGVFVAKLEQDPVFPPGASILEISERAFAQLDALEAELTGLERQGLDQAEVYERWEKLHETFERRGGYERRSRRDAVLHALGFRSRENEPAGRLSGGEKTRLGLAQLLMAQPDVLLLDEPTNHLDMRMRAWLEGYLGRYPGAVLIVSHDRELLDRSSSQTADIAFGVLRAFEGTPSQYRAYRAEQLRIEELTRRNEARERDRLTASATQMKRWAGQNEKLHRRAKAMFKRVERFEAQMLGEADPEAKTTRFRFHSQPSGDIVLQAQRLSKRFGEVQLFEDIGFTLRQGERVALVGPNGAGKSTFLKLLLGELPSDDPRALLRYGARVRVGYYDQELRGVEPEATLIEELIRLVGDAEAHNLLGRFLFPFEAQYKLVKNLSGGERSRLAILKLTLGEYNFLVLDEPTNHLDVEMIEALEVALNAFEGTLLIVSHDRRFIQETTDLVWALQDGRLEQYEGDWDFYQRKEAERQRSQKGEAADARTPSPDAQAKGPSRWQLVRDLEALEARIAGLEEDLAAVGQRLHDVGDLSPEAIADLGENHARLEVALLEALAAWEATSEQLSTNS